MMENNNPKLDPGHNEVAGTITTRKGRAKIAWLYSLYYQWSAALCYLKRYFGRTTKVGKALFRPSRRALLKDLVLLGIGGWSIYDHIRRGKDGHAVAVATHPSSNPASIPSNERSERALRFALTSLRFLNPIPRISIAAIPASRLSNAPRPYRHGIHNGFDLYCSYRTDVHAIADGVITRADQSFIELDPGLYQLFLTMSRKLDATPPDILSRLLGQCIEIDHGMQHGFRFRSVYAHLSAVNVSEGAYIHQGDVLGAVGNSGTSAGIRGSHDEAHLHLEIRLQRPGERESYLGENLSEEQIRQLLKEIFINA